MSQYNIIPKNPDHEILIGWDPMLLTYFIHVIDTTKDEDDEDRDLLWCGTSRYEITDLEVLDGLVRDYSKSWRGMPEKLFTKLFAEAD